MFSDLGIAIVEAVVGFLVGALFTPIAQLASDFFGFS